MTRNDPKRTPMATNERAPMSTHPYQGFPRWGRGGAPIVPTFGLASPHRDHYPIPKAKNSIFSTFLMEIWQNLQISFILAWNWF